MFVQRTLDEAVTAGRKTGTLVAVIVVGIALLATIGADGPLLLYFLLLLLYGINLLMLNSAILGFLQV
jgi:hypothetical protein